MPKYIIEREIPNAAAIPAADLKGIAQRSCAVLKQLGPSIPVGAELCDRGQDHLCVHCPQRRHNS